MKKITKIFASAILAVSTLAFTSCGFFSELFGEAAEIIAPVDVWCPLTVSVGTTNVELNIMYTDQQWVGTSKSKNNSLLKDGITIEPGLSILVTLDSDQDPSGLVGSIFEGLTAETYLFKTFPKDGSVEDVGGDMLNFTGSKTTWAAMYVAKQELRYGEQIQMPNVPIYLTYAAGKLGAQDFADFKNFSWKKLLAQHLAQNLLGE